MTKPTKLELTWIEKENRPRLEPRILIEDPAKSYHAKFRTKAVSSQPSAVSRADSRKLIAESSDFFDNRFIFGDGGGRV